MSNSTLSRSLHDVGLAAWFGGSLMGAVGLNGGAATAKKNSERTKIASEGWAKWTPVNAVAIGAHLIGSVGMLAGDKGRIGSQDGVGTAVFAKTALTAVALGVTGYARVLGKKIETLSPAPSDGVTEPNVNTPPELAAAQTQEHYLQWAIPAVTGVLIVVSALMGEQQRPTSVVAGTVEKVRGLIS